MSKCLQHGYYDDHYDLVGVGCPKCAEYEDRQSMSDTIFDQDHCQICHQPLDEHETTQERGIIFERFEIHSSYGEGEEYEREERLEHFCGTCYINKIKPLFKIKREKN